MRRVWIFSLAVLMTACLSARPEAGDVVSGKCISVTDGDSISLMTDTAVLKVRLEGIDAPERGQEYSKKATQALAQKVKGKEVSIEVTGYDKYQRVLAQLLFEGENINFWLVRNGWAWQFTEHDDSEELKLAQESAQEEKKGLWAGQIEPMAPWEYRDRQRKLVQIQRQKEAERKAQEINRLGVLDTPVPAYLNKKAKQASSGSYWMNISSSVRHNQGCRYYRNTKRGRACGGGEGKACGICGG